jgi:hypothetical protein
MDKIFWTAFKEELMKIAVDSAELAKEEANEGAKSALPTNAKDNAKRTKKKHPAAEEKGFVEKKIEE